jgi:adenylate cyclase
MEPSRQTTVLFADVSGSTRLYETAGDSAALEAIGHCIEKLRQATETDGGRVLKTIGDEVMALFPSPDAAASAAVQMHTAIEALPAVGDTKLSVRIGFHAGPVIQRDNDAFGDTVNVAARLVEQAMKGQILVAEETATLLGPLFVNWARRLYSIRVKGKGEEVMLCELVWRRTADMTAMAGARAVSRSPRSALRLKYHDREIVRRRDNESITIGREQSCGVVIADQNASRQHCTIERRQDKFVLKDHSSNGTFVTVDGDIEILLQREEFTLRKHGWIAFGQSRAGTAELVEYFCE